MDATDCATEGGEQDGFQLEKGCWLYVGLSRTKQQNGASQLDRNQQTYEAP